MNTYLAKAFVCLLIGHAAADYPLQGNFLSKGKNRHHPQPGVPWYWCMGAHAALHAGMVWALTGKWWLGALEFFFHAAIDDTKCAGDLSFDVDQMLHVVCKLTWIALLGASLT